jgi:hypothetical protein
VGSSPSQKVGEKVTKRTRTAPRKDLLIFKGKNQAKTDLKESQLVFNL